MTNSTFKKELEEFKRMIDTTDLSSMDSKVRSVFEKLSTQIGENPDSDDILTTLLECMSVTGAKMPEYLADALNRPGSHRSPDLTDYISKASPEALQSMVDAIREKDKIKNMSADDQMLSFAVALSALFSVKDSHKRDELRKSCGSALRRELRQSSNSSINKAKAAMDDALDECFKAIERCWSRLDEISQERQKSQQQQNG